MDQRLRRAPGYDGDVPDTAGDVPIPRPIRTNSTPTAIAIAATPKEATEVNSETTKDEAVIAVSTLGVLAVRSAYRRPPVASRACFDDHRLAVGAEGPVDFVAGQTGGVVRHGDLLIGQGGADHDPGRNPDDEERADRDRVEAVLRMGVRFRRWGMGWQTTALGRQLPRGDDHQGSPGSRSPLGRTSLRDQGCGGKRCRGSGGQLN